MMTRKPLTTADPQSFRDRVEFYLRDIYHDFRWHFCGEREKHLAKMEANRQRELNDPKSDRYTWLRRLEAAGLKRQHAWALRSIALTYDLPQEDIMQLMELAGRREKMKEDHGT